MPPLTTIQRRHAPPRLLTALLRAGMPENEIRRHYALSPEEPVLHNPTESLEIVDLEFLPDDGYRYELWEGELVRMSPAKPRHGEISGAIVTELGIYLRGNRIGKVYTAEAGFRVGPHRSVYCPDAAYVSNERLAGISPDEYFPFAPDIAVEVWSPDNTQSQMEAKAAHYLQHGAKRVWVLRPRDQSAQVYRSDTPMQTLSADDFLNGDEVLPGFSVRLGDLFSQ